MLVLRVAEATEAPMASRELPIQDAGTLSTLAGLDNRLETRLDWTNKVSQGELATDERQDTRLARPLYWCTGPDPAPGQFNENLMNYKRQALRAITSCES